MTYYLPLYSKIEPRGIFELIIKYLNGRDRSYVYIEYTDKWITLFIPNIFLQLVMVSTHITVFYSGK